MLCGLYYFFNAGCLRGLQGALRLVHQGAGFLQLLLNGLFHDFSPPHFCGSNFPVKFDSSSYYFPS